MINKSKLKNRNIVTENIKEDALRLKRNLTQEDLEKAYEKGYGFARKETKKSEPETATLILKKAINEALEVSPEEIEREKAERHSRFAKALKEKGRK